MPSNPDPPPDGGTRRKAVLYCPVCGHESLVGGDWRVERAGSGERVVYACPDCGHVIDVRSAESIPNGSLSARPSLRR